jgi:GNAT superfamily N-acetyltransferase
MSQTGLEARLQEQAARAVPAEENERIGQWWLRHAPGCSWWISAVLPHGDVPVTEMDARISAAEAYCAERGVPALFQMTPGAVAPELDTTLEARGYTRKASVSLQTATTSSVLALAPRGSLRVRLEERPTPEWFEAWHAVTGGALEQQRQMLARITERSAYASVDLGAETVAVGRAVVESGWAGVFSMATRPEARGKGAAAAVLGALADWAAVNDAERMYLQVEHENAGAMRLYERVGFSELCGFSFRVKE